MPLDVITFIVLGEHNCLICHRAITQNDADAGAVFGFGTEETMRFACLAHFFDDAQNNVCAEDYQQNIRLVAAAIQEELQ